jgi:hypothetical protein
VSKVFKDAVAEAATLPEAAQDKIGRELRAYLDKLHRLQSDVEQGIRSLDAGAGKAINVEDLIEHSRAS